MADDVSVTFGASIDRLIAGISSATDAVKDFARGVEEIKGTAETVAEALAAAFAVEKIAQFVEKMAALGEQAERTMATLGVSAQQVAVLDGIARLTGTTLDGLALSFERMTLNVQKSQSDGFSPAAAGLRVLGLSARDLIGLPADQYFLRLSDAVSKFNPSLNLTNAIMAVGGRSVANMLPALLMGRERFDEMEVAIKKAKDGFEQAAPAMADTDAKLKLMQISAESFGQRIFTVFKPAIDLVITSLTKFFQSMDAQTIQDAAKKIIDAVASAVIFLGTLFQNLFQWMSEAEQKMQTWATVAGVIGQAMAKAAMPGYALGLALGDLAKSGGDTFATRFAASGGAAAAASSEWSDKVRKLAADLKAAMNAGGGEHGAGDKKDASALGMGGKDQLNAAMKEIQGEITLLQAGLAQKQLILNGEAENFRLTQDQKFASLQRFTQEAYQEELRLLQKEAALGGLTVAQRAQINEQIKLLEVKHNSDMIRLDQQAVAAQRQIYDTWLGGLQSSFNGQLRGLLAGTTSWAQAWKAIMGDMVVFAIQQIEKMAAQWIAAELAKTTATTTGAAERAAAETAGSSTSIFTTITNAIKSIFSSVGTTTAGVTAAVAPFAGPAAPAIGAAAGAETMATAMAFIPSFDVGTNYVVRTGLANIHKGEQIIPAAKGSGPYTGGGGKGGNGSGSGGMTMNVSVKSMDGMDAVRALKRNSRALLLGIQREGRRTNQRRSLQSMIGPQFA